MESYLLPGSGNTPEVNFDFGSRRLLIRGESHPEDVASFYGPVMAALDAFLAANAGEADAGVAFDFELVYFNSSTAKVIMDIFDRLDAHAAKGAPVVLRWIYDVEDDNMQELGEDFGEDLEHAAFEMVESDAGDA